MEERGRDGRRWEEIKMLREFIWCGGLDDLVLHIMYSNILGKKGGVSFAKLDKIPYTKTPYNSCYMVLDVKNTTFHAYS